MDTGAVRKGGPFAVPCGVPDGVPTDITPSGFACGASYRGAMRGAGTDTRRKRGAACLRRKGVVHAVVPVPAGCCVADRRTP